MPKSGKTTTIDVLRTYFQRQGYDVRVFHDAAVDSEIDKEQIGALNIQIAAELVKFIVSSAFSKDVRRTIVFLDRGLFDRCIFTQILRDQGRIDEPEANAVTAFLLQNRLLSLISRVFLFVADEKDCMERENKFALTPSDGRIMNNSFLSAFRETALAKSKELLPNYIPVTIIDTSFSDGRIVETVKEIAAVIELHLQDSDFSGSYSHEFHPVEDMYLYSGLADSTPGPYRVNIRGEIFHRYMDYFYSRRKPWEMSTEESISICELRNSNIDSVVDEELNRNLIGSMIELAGQLGSEAQDLKVLDFGCGDGLSTNIIRENLDFSDIVGTDASHKAVERCKQKFPDESFVHTSELGAIPEKTFDIIFSVFVMHFLPPVEDLKELHRVSKEGSAFFFNLYNMELQQLKRSIVEAGWSIPKLVNAPGLKNNHRLYVAYAT